MTFSWLRTGFSTVGVWAKDDTQLSLQPEFGEQQALLMR